MVPGLDSHLHIVADDTRAAPARRLKEEMAKLDAHETRMLASPDEQISLTDPDSRSMAGRALTYRMALRQLLLEMLLLDRQRLRRHLPVGGIEPAQAARYALLQLRTPSLDFRLGEVAVAIVDRFELAAVDGDARR